MLDYINNLNLESSINKDQIFNLFKTKSSNINTIILSKIEDHKKISDFFCKYTNLDINSISNSIDILKNQFSKILIPCPKNNNGDLELYINILSTFILVIHYTNKLRTLFYNITKEIRQNLIGDLLNNKLGEPYKDKIIEYNSLAYSALSSTLKNEICFSKFIDNKPKILNHFESKGKRYFNKEDPTPTFFVFDKDTESPLNKLNNQQGNENENQKLESKEETFQNKCTKEVNKPSCSMISMSSLLVINNNREEKKKIKKKESLKKRVKRYSSLENKKIKIKSPMNNLIERKIVSGTSLNSKQINIEENKNCFNSERKNSVNYIFDKEGVNFGNKDIYAEFFKFANELYKDNYINENQKIGLKQLIIKYITFKHLDKKE